MNFVSQLWKDVMAAGVVYIVAEEGNFPFIEPPDEEEMPDFSMLMCFSTEAGADDYKKMVIELSELRPSQLRVMPIALDDVWSMIEELKQFCQEEYESKFRIELVNAAPGQDVLAHDTIYVQEEMLSN